MDKQREEFIKEFHCVPEESKESRLKAIGFSAGYKAAQAAMQPELDAADRANKIAMHQNLDLIDAAMKTEKQLSAANQRIEELLDLVEVVERRNKQLEERIRVADAEEPVYVQDTTSLSLRIIPYRGNATWTTGWRKLYLHPQIPADAELKEKEVVKDKILIENILVEDAPVYKDDVFYRHGIPVRVVQKLGGMLILADGTRISPSALHRGETI